MSVTRLGTPILLAASCVAAWPVAAADVDDLSREAISQFLSSLKSKDAGAVLKFADVPWFHKGRKVITDRDELRQEFENLFNKQDFADLKHQVKRILPYESVREKTDEGQRKQLDQVLKGEDRVALVQLSSSRSKEETVVLLVRIRDGAARIVGIKD